MSIEILTKVSSCFFNDSKPINKNPHDLITGDKKLSAKHDNCMKRAKLYSLTSEIKSPFHNNLRSGPRTLSYLYKSFFEEIIKQISQKQVFHALCSRIKMKKPFTTFKNKSNQSLSKNKLSNIFDSNNNISRQREINKEKLNVLSVNGSAERLSVSHKHMYHYVSQYLSSFDPTKISKEGCIFKKNLSTGNLSNSVNIRHLNKTLDLSGKEACNRCKVIDSLSKAMNVESVKTKLQNNIPSKQKNNNDSQSKDDDDAETSSDNVNETMSKKSSGLKYSNKNTIYSGKENYENESSALCVDGCSLWKFPPWLVERLDLDQIVQDISTFSIERYRALLMRQLKSTATDLLLYQTVRREFLRTILVIELNNIVKLMEFINKLGLDDNLRKEFFQRLRSIVSALDNQQNIYIPEMEEMAYVLDELFLLIAPTHIMKDALSYHFNVIYCSYLISRWAVVFNENCTGGIIDNTLFANESKYHCMVMVTPHVYDEPSMGDPARATSSNFRIETYFDVDRGIYAGFELDFTKSIDPKYVLSRNLECLIYTYLTREAHWVEDKNIFLLNGPADKGNLDFTKIYYALLKDASL